MKTVLITGGARGIGRGLVAEFARDHNVAFTYNATPPPPEASGFGIKADLSDTNAPAQIIDAVIKKFGALDVLVNNAGAIEMTVLDAVNAADEAKNLSVNLTAPMLLLAAALPHLNAGAAVVNVSSVNAVLPAMGASGYSASKAALNTWTHGAAKELGPKGIRVNAVAPGAIERLESPRDPELLAKFVELTALGRHGVPDDIAKAVRFLASEDASFITGQVLRVCGGYRL